jgi:hypothetical protein
MPDRRSSDAVGFLDLLDDHDTRVRGATAQALAVGFFDILALDKRGTLLR